MELSSWLKCRWTEIMDRSHADSLMLSSQLVKKLKKPSSIWTVAKSMAKRSLSLMYSYLTDQENVFHHHLVAISAVETQAGDDDLHLVEWVDDHHLVSDVVLLADRAPDHDQDHDLLVEIAVAAHPQDHQGRLVCPLYIHVIESSQ